MLRKNLLVVKLVYFLYCFKKKMSSLESWYYVECYFFYDVNILIGNLMCRFVVKMILLGFWYDVEEIKKKKFC